MSGASLRVIICDKYAIPRFGLLTILASRPGVEVIEATDSGVHAIMLARQHHPEVVVTGLTLGGLSGLELIQRLRAEKLDPQPRVVVFTVDHTDQTFTEVLRAGANGLLTQDSTQDEVVAIIRAAGRGQTLLSPLVTQRLVEWFRQREPPAAAEPRLTLAGLTPREQQVLLLVAQGRSTEEVAGELYIGVSTVRTHLHRLRAKLKAKDRAQLVSLAYRAGLMST
ncbi:response regulator [Nonomuraea rhizosphaerae]|uniref:response regulator n=1 Tax=Nonomuraea rhizosphaerae TaxID=2665663 RepID=UPI001FE4DE7E|nr:response regulator transcription factor [Nonomuraea rhizosphaerae]